MEELVDMKASADEQAAVRQARLGRRSRRARGARWLAGGLAAAFVAAALPAVAGATDYCVDATPACGPKNVASFEQALDQAGNAPDADRVFLGAATYTAPDESGFKYYGASGPVEVIGQGAGQTILTNPGPGNDGAVVNLFGGDGTSIHDLTIRLPQNAQMTGLMTTNTAQRIEIVEDPTQAYNRTGAELEYGGTLEDSTVTVGNAQGARAVRLGNGGGTVRRSVLSGRTGVVSDYGGTIERSRITSAANGLLANGGVTTVTASLIRLTETGGDAISALTHSGTHTTVNGDGVTIIGPGLAPSAGATVATESAPTESADLNLTNSIIRGVSTPLIAAGTGPGLAQISASYSDYDSSNNIRMGASATINEANVSNAGEAGFVDAPGGDYRLLPGSPLLDTGDPASAQGLDLDGNPLVSDGNGDGSGRRDLGAFELQPVAAVGSPPPDGGTAGGADTQAPLVTGFKAAPSLFAVARAGTPLAARVPRGTRFRYTLSEDARVTTTIQRALPGRRAHGRCMRPAPRLRLARRCTRYRAVGTLKRSATKGANSIRFTGRIGSRTLRPGRYRALITATDTAGNRSTPRTARFRVAHS